MKKLGIYIHIPFCKHKCTYCDFLSFIPRNEDRMEMYCRYLVKEIALYKKQAVGCEVDTIYFGGGTPSLLTPKQIETILHGIEDAFFITQNPEITIEVNPETVDATWVEALAKTSINRVSVGLQDTHDEVLHLVGRQGNKEDFFQTMKAFKDFGFNNISADMMLGLPLQNKDSILSVAKTIVALDIPHISAYSLIVHEDTSLYGFLKKNPTLLPTEEEEREMYYRLTDYLEAQGFVRYEISNFAKPGYESRHNLKYWNLDPYVGIGLGAAGFYNKERRVNPKSFQVYYDILDKGELPYKIEYSLTKEDEMSEFAFLSIRRREGISLLDFKNRFGVEFFDVFSLEKHFQSKLVELRQGHVVLTPKGSDLSNLVEVDLIL
ncbi:MAG: radical SAM family heme chaperone HemW [Tissierellia bacterium]|nr:radical SAM family heme chaperone HemW [Tissierellia bacterium]